MNVSYLNRFNVSPVDEYSSTHEKVQLNTQVQFSLLVSTLSFYISGWYFKVLAGSLNFVIFVLQSFAYDDRYQGFKNLLFGLLLLNTIILLLIIRISVSHEVKAFLH